MKNRIQWALLATSLSFVAACGGSDEAPDTDATMGDTMEVPTQDEADAAADESITDENADAELDALIGEIGE